jgi:spoIIIJ-associated protein
VAAQRGGRRRATQLDVVREALTAALADALDVDVDRIALTVALDDAPIPADRLPLVLTVSAQAAPAPSTLVDADGADEVEDAVEPSEGAVRDQGSAGREQEDMTRPSGRRGGARNGSAPSEASASAPVSAEDLDEEAEAAADLLEGLLDAMDLPGDLRISVQEAHAEVEVIGLEEGVLIGRRGQTLDAVQELVRTAMQRRFERRSRVLVDVDGYRARRLEKLLERADEAVEEVLETGEPQRLEPMDAIERRLVHQRVAETAGVVSTSHGREPSRRIVIERE